MDVELTEDELLRALAALEAVVRDDDAALAALAGGAGERALPLLLAAYGRKVLIRILATLFGVDPAMGREETSQLVAEINADPMARMVIVLTGALHNQAAPAGDDPAVAKQIGGSILMALHAFTDADHQEAMIMLRALRSEVLHS
ncbi:hypothetical protein [Kitasatospora sp. NPDC088783]|uniref:hypothetical protein n=1 Tax=Kitasatospora sp. NPDC088783 TaxID=3364077 RepID=UPI00382DFAC4